MKLRLHTKNLIKALWGPIKSVWDNESYRGL